MNFLKLFGRKQESERADATPEITCPHVMLTPRWDSADDIGHEDRAVGYRCTACGASLTLEEGIEARNRHIFPTN